jgi:hypothetical protein
VAETNGARLAPGIDDADVELAPGRRADPAGQGAQCLVAERDALPDPVGIGDCCEGAIGLGGGDLGGLAGLPVRQVLDRVGQLNELLHELPLSRTGGSGHW